MPANRPRVTPGHQPEHGFTSHLFSARCFLKNENDSTKRAKPFRQEAKMRIWAIVTLILGVCMSGTASLHGQTGDLKLLDWQPASQMVVKETKIMKPKFPVIDIQKNI